LIKAKLWVLKCVVSVKAGLLADDTTGGAQNSIRHNDGLLLFSVVAAPTFVDTAQR